MFITGSSPVTLTNFNMSKSKDKGDIGMSQVIADFYRHNIKVALPISDHLPFDLIAISNIGILSRVSVKYKKVYKDRGILVSLETVYKNNTGTHRKIADKKWYDSVALYCPDTTKCYYFLKSEIPDGGQLIIRPDYNEITNGINNNRMRNADEYQDPNRIFMDS